jgi:hypothetical protein
VSIIGTTVDGIESAADSPRCRLIPVLRGKDFRRSDQSASSDLPGGVIDPRHVGGSQGFLPAGRRGPQ